MAHVTLTFTGTEEEVIAAMKAFVAEREICAPEPAVCDTQEQQVRRHIHAYIDKRTFVDSGPLMKSAWWFCQRNAFEISHVKIVKMELKQMVEQGKLVHEAHLSGRRGYTYRRMW